jgi:hypothetical protein
MEHDGAGSSDHGAPHPRLFAIPEAAINGMNSAAASPRAADIRGLEAGFGEPIVGVATTRTLEWSVQPLPEGSAP